MLKFCKTFWGLLAEAKIRRIIEKNEVKDSVLKTAAEICAYYSKGREGGKTEIVYTLKKHVKKPPSAKAGFVVYTDYKSIFVFPDKHENQLK